MKPLRKALGVFSVFLFCLGVGRPSVAIMLSCNLGDHCDRQYGLQYVDGSPPEEEPKAELCPHGVVRNSDGSCPPPMVCPAGQSLRGSGGSNRVYCICDNGSSEPDCGASAGKTEPTSAPACRGRVYQWADQCAAQGAAAQSACSERTETHAFEAGTAKARNDLQGQQNANQACQAAAQADRETAAQLGGMAQSCQSAVSQCSNACGRMMQEVSGCEDGPARQRAQALLGTQTSCSPGGAIASRPQQISQRGQTLNANAQEIQQSCVASTAASERTSSSTGPLAQRKTETSGGGPGSGGALAEGTLENPGSSERGVPLADEGGKSLRGDPIDTSGRDADGKQKTNEVGAVLAVNPLAELPGTPVVSKNIEETPDSLGAGTLKAAESAGFMRGNGGRRSLVLSRPSSYRSSAEMDTAGGTPAAAAEEEPDLSQFLPGARGVAGRRGLGANFPAGCRLVDPDKPRECAVFHGPERVIWDALKARTEELRWAPPPADNFFEKD